MTVSARLQNSEDRHEVFLETNNKSQSITIPSKPAGYGSSVSGGELLFLALATCYCNDIYREAAHRGIAVVSVEVSVEGEFDGEGEPARSIFYDAKVTAQAPENDIKDLLLHTDRVAEIQNALRAGTAVSLRRIEAASVE